MSDKPIIHSHGGGTQSIAISVLVVQGLLPRPERVVIADTGRERTSTWEYMDAYVRPLLSKVGLEVEVAPHSLATVDLYAKNDDLLMPAWTENGQMSTFCSNEWKQRVIARHLRAEGYGPDSPITLWMGMSLDEIGRMKQSGPRWWTKAWPLVFNDHEKRYTRGDCVRIVEEAGLPTPPKSSCWMCPFMRNSQWRDVRDNHPRDWRRAVELDKNIRERDEQHDVYVHRDAVPLAEADLEEKDRPQLPLFGDIEDCESGFCMV